jgi:hypothetical protein
VSINVFLVDARLLARGQYLKGPATSHLNTGFSWFLRVFKQMLSLFPRLRKLIFFRHRNFSNQPLLAVNFSICKLDALSAAFAYSIGQVTGMF